MVTAADLARLARGAGKLAREIVAKRVAVVGAVTALGNVAVSYHWITPKASDYVDSWVIRGLDVLAAIVCAIWIRTSVTPADPALHPTSTDGKTLIEYSDVAPGP